MRPVKDLRRLGSPAIRKMRRLSGIIDLQSKLVASEQDSRVVAYLVLELQNTWVELVESNKLCKFLPLQNLPKRQVFAHLSNGV